MRKLEKKNLISFYIFGAMILLAIGGISFGVFQVASSGVNLNFEISSGSVVYDSDDNLVPLEGTAKLSKKWDGNYYIKTSGGQTKCLGKSTVVFDKNATKVKIFGDSYKINMDGSVYKYLDQIEVTDIGNPSLYKLDDRKYLMIGKNINSVEGPFATKNYMIINMDKWGNALLRGEGLNRKTISPVVLQSEDLYFDIGSELMYTEGKEINLKNVIGSTNLYGGKPLLYEQTGIDSANVERTDAGTGDTGGTGGTGGAAGPQNYTVVAGKGGTGGGGGIGGAGGIGGTGGIGGSGGIGGYGGVGGSAGSGGSGGTGGTGGDGGDAGMVKTENLIKVAMGTVSTREKSIVVNYSVYDPSSNVARVKLLAEPWNSTTSAYDPGTTYDLSKLDTEFTLDGLNENTKYRLTLSYTKYEIKNGKYQSDEVNPFPAGKQEVKTTGFVITAETDRVVKATNTVSGSAVIAVKLNGLTAKPQGPLKDYYGTIRFNIKTSGGAIISTPPYRIGLAAAYNEGYKIDIPFAKGDEFLSVAAPIVDMFTDSGTPISSVTVKFDTLALKDYW